MRLKGNYYFIQLFNDLCTETTFNGVFLAAKNNKIIFFIATILFNFLSFTL